MRVNFYLKDPSSKQKTYIYCQIYSDGQKKRISTSLETFPKDWNTKQQKMKGTHEQSYSINNRINAIRDRLIEIETEYVEGNKKVILDEVVYKFKNAPKKVSDIYDYAQQDFNERVDDKFKTNDYYRIALKHLHDFIEISKVSRSFMDIDTNWHKKYIRYLKEKGHSPNTRYQYNHYLRGLMRRSMEDQLHSNKSFRDFKAEKTSSPKVALLKSEIESLYKLKMPTKRLEEARDVWVFGSYTGLRYSDWSRVKKLLSEDYSLAIIHRKTSVEVQIPLSQTAKEILGKYNNELPVKKYLAQRNTIKEIFEFAKDHIPTLKTEMKVRKEDKYEIVQRWQLCNTHTARRTFASVLYRHRDEIGSGLTKRDIMALTGHKSEKAFDAYIVTDDYQTHVPISEFFSNPVTLSVAR